MDFLGGVRVSIWSLRGVRVRALGISRVMKIRARGGWGVGQPPNPQNGFAPIGFGAGAPEAGREWGEPRRIGASFARFELPIPRGSGKLAGMRVRESRDAVNRRDLRYATEIARVVRPGDSRCDTERKRRNYEWSPEF